jgi:hypothetical protein
MLTAGIAPVAYNSILTGMSLELYTQRTSQGLYLGESQITTTINGTTYTESSTNCHNRVLNDKKSAYADANAIVTRITGDAQVSIGIPVQVAVPSGTGSTTGLGSII